MKPATWIGALDRSLARNGSTVTLKRGTPQAPSSSATVKAHVRDFRLDELIGSLQQDDTKVIVSPTALNGFVPQRNDWIVIAGRTRSVVNVDPFQVADTLVRYELVVRGAG